ncbi:MAG: methyltransferase domain-containing protein [Sphingomonadales bacterium]
MSTAMEIFDRRLVRQRRDRKASTFDDFEFLKTEVADRLADRLLDINRQFKTALDLGCHTGAMGRLLAARPDLETLVSADLSPRMAALAPGLRVAADEELLPFAEECFDLAVSALSLHWVNDLPGALIQLNRALKPDGLLLAAMLGGDTLTELRQAMMQAELAVEPGVAPRVSPFADIRDAGGLLQRAGFALPVTDVERITVDYADAFSLMRDLQGMAEANAVFERHKAPLKRRTVIAAMEAYHDLYGRRDGRVPATFDIIFLTGWAPHESQQKPLAPGSATMRLAQVLGTREQSTGEKTSPRPWKRP